MKASKQSKFDTAQLESKSSLMKPGFYELHILIEATSALSLVRDSSIDALISVKAFNKLEYTKIKKGVGFQQILWAQHFYFDKYFTEDDHVNQHVIIIEAWDHNKILKNSLIGVYELNVQRIYSENQHAMTHTWLTLSDVTNNFGEIVGYIKISVCVTGENDKGVTLDIEPFESINKERKVLMPPHLQRKSFQLTMQIYQGKNLRPADGQTVDPYIGVQFGQIYQKTDTAIKNCNPEWLDKVYVLVHLPAIIDNIILRLIDVNIIQDKEVLGSYYFNINRLINQSNSNRDTLSNIASMQWINLYGPQNQGSNEDARRNYQLYPDNAPYYIGSVLLRAKLEPKSNPVTRKEKMYVKYDMKPLKFYFVEADIELAINLPSGFSKFKIGIRIGSDYVQTNDWSENRNGFGLWFIHKTFGIAFYENQPIPDVFVYLVNNKGIKMCFTRKPVILLGTIYQNRWRIFKPDLAVNKIFSEEAGYIKMGLTITKSLTQKKQPPAETKIDKYFKFSVNFLPCRVVIDMICAESLLPGDDDGSTDPYFTFSYMAKEVTSSKKESILNPVYFQKYIMDGFIGSQNEISPLIVKAYNKNPLSNELIGSCFIDLQKGIAEKTVLYNESVNSNPVWYDLYIENIKHGRFLAGITVVKSQNIPIPKQIDIKMKKYQLNLYILGLRGLKSTGIVSIRKPYIEFDFDSLFLYDKDSKNSFTRNVRTEPQQSGNSINIKMPTKTVLNLPENQQFWPTLSGKVKDYVIGGLYQPILGYFSINLRESYDRTKNAREQFLKDNTIQDQKTVSRRKSKLQGISDFLIISLRTYIIKNVNYNWSVMEPSVPLISIKGADKKLDPNMIVILPNYVQTKKGTFKEQYKEIIDRNGEYIKVGYDRKENMLSQIRSGCNKHYRYCLDESYEEYYERVNKVKLGIYDQITVRRGKVILPQSSDAFLTKLIHEEDLAAGHYKGNCYISQYQQNSEGPFQHVAQVKLQNYMKQSRIKMFLYILDARDVPSKDTFSKSDPFIIVNMGNKQISFKDSYIQDSDQPEFNIKIVEDLVFPTNSEIQIQVWDYDPIGMNQFIGSTTINAENRVFARFGKINFNNPIETHKLMAKQSKQSQGRLRFWVDFIPYDHLPMYKELDIFNKAPVDYEIRVIVWSCSEVSSEDHDFSDMNDLFVACTFNGETEETDVHLRSQSGEGSFNWRMVFPVKLPLKDPTMTFKVYDKDIVSRDQFLASGTLSINAQLSQAYENQAGIKLYLGEEDQSLVSNIPCMPEKGEDGETRFDVFDVNLFNRPRDNSMGQIQAGKVLVSVQILPKEEADRKKVGTGRSQPNLYPKLPEPIGRMQWSWNPLTMLTRLVGKGLINKVILAFVAFLLLSVIWYFIPSLLGSLVAKAI